MKYWEIVKSLTENPSLSGKAVTDSIQYELYVNDSGTLQSSAYYLQLGTKGTSTGKAGNIDFDGWEIVHQPVTWQEAIQAWAHGKTVIVENTCDKRKYDGKKFFLKDEYGIPLGSWGITNGTWYIED